MSTTSRVDNMQCFQSPSNSIRPSMHSNGRHNNILTDLISSASSDDFSTPKKSPTIPHGISKYNKWQSCNDLQIRRVILFQILLLLKAKCGSIDEKISNIAKRTELALYTRADSLAEYSCFDSLAPRIQSLIIKLYINQVLTTKKKDSKNIPVISRKRKFFQISSSLSYPFFQTNILFHQSQEIIEYIFSYVERKDIVEASAVCKLAYDILPPCIHEMDLYTDYMEKLSKAKAQRLLIKMSNLTRISLHGSSLSIMDFHSNSGLYNFIEAMKHADLSKLELLSIDNAYCDDLEDSSTAAIAELLSRKITPSLESLYLRGNCISDEGAHHISSIIKRNDCPNLLHLDLEANYLGERGSVSICNAIATSDDTLVYVVVLQDNLVQGRGIDRLAKFLNHDYLGNFLIIKQNELGRCESCHICQCCGKKVDIEESTYLLYI